MPCHWYVLYFCFTSNACVEAEIENDVVNILLIICNAYNNYLRLM